MTSTDDVLGILNDYLGTIVSRSIVQTAANTCALAGNDIPAAQREMYIAAVDSGVNAFIAIPMQKQECRERLRALIGAPSPDEPDSYARLIIEILHEFDVVTARNHVKQLCQNLGFSIAEQVKVATAVSELARNIVQYVGSGRIELDTVTLPHPGIEIRAIDEGPGISNIDEIIAGNYSSKTGMGVGLLGTRRIMDEFRIESTPDRGTRVYARKYVA
jgi:serine/threonine-protein kinase RsbT